MAARERALVLVLATGGCLALACGAFSAEVPLPTSDYQEPPITEIDRQHWSFQPIVRPKLTEVTEAKDWSRGGVDRLILIKLQEKKTLPAGEASRETLLRRLSFDLTGLPPTLAEIEAFTNDDQPDAYERLVDRLLASTAYGERWGQHWLDLARFSETDGFEHDLVRKEAWRYRDWVVGALNADLPYDEFVRQQVAGDEGLESGDRSQGSEVIASQISNFKSEISDGAKSKIEPLTRNSIPTMFCLSGPDMPDINSQEQRKHELLNEVTGTFGSVFLGLQIGCAQCHDHKYDPLSQADFYRLRAFFEPAVSLQKDVSVIALHNDEKFKGPARLWIRGDWQRPGMELQPAFVRVLLPASGGREPPDTTFTENEPKNQGAHAPRSPRTQLARWVTSPAHPLTSRVIVNRLWQHHFGKGIVESPSDFGLMGSPPSNPQLLDWLANELITTGWSLKKLHREIVYSATYRQASRKPRRLEGEAIRDAMLAASGQLDFRRGGPGVMPPLPEELTKTLLPNQWKASENPADATRRSIYIFARRNLRYPLFEAFDRPDPNASCPLRGRSTTAPQSLLLFNSEFSLSCAKHLAAEVLRDEPQDVSAHISAACRRTWGRSPTEQEQRTLLEFVSQQEEQLRREGKSKDDALVDLCLALLNSNEFLYLD